MLLHNDWSVVMNHSCCCLDGFLQSTTSCLTVACWEFYQIILDVLVTTYFIIIIIIIITIISSSIVSSSISTIGIIITEKQ